MNLLRGLTIACLSIAVVAGVGLLGLDLASKFSAAATHQQASAIALMAVGASYVLVHLTGRIAPRTRLKAVLLGGAFFIWGSEQFIKPGPIVIGIDCLIILIFVVDLGLSVLERLKAGNRPEGSD